MIEKRRQSVAAAEEVCAMVGEVVKALRERGAHFDIRHHQPTYSGLQEANALGLRVDDVLKTVVLEARDSCCLAVLPAGRRLDMGLIRDATSDRHARLATEAEIEGALPECELGAVPPLGSVIQMKVYVDPEVLRHPVVAFAAGTQTESVKGPTEELFNGETVTITPITEPPGGWPPADG